ncbi:bifunctional DNA primase/polymerase [Mycolicibacterium cosmeticum]|uniref:bifunctional DNA primase/polymerase n=1 Tax=Mycolicibacterium cosmeticum TaxID=258533 RepID=UPI003204F29B
MAEPSTSSTGGAFGRYAPPSDGGRPLRCGGTPEPHPNSVSDSAWVSRGRAGRGPGACRDPEQIRRWWKANPRYAIMLHCGRSGAGVVDLDVSTLDDISQALDDISQADIAEALPKAGSVQGTRPDGDRGHYLFLLPDDRKTYGNSAGAFRRWGEFRGKNGVIIAAPTPHPDAESKGGVYIQRRTGPVGSMPEVLRKCLSEAGETADPLTDAELSAFLDVHTGEGCGRDDCSIVVDGAVKNFHTAAQDGASRYGTLVNVAPGRCRKRRPAATRRAMRLKAMRAMYFDAFGEADSRARLAQVEFLAYTGLRAGEVAGLEVAHLLFSPGPTAQGGVRCSVRVVRTKDRKNGVWVVGTPKSKRSRRTVPLPPWLARRMVDYLD